MCPAKQYRPTAVCKKYLHMSVYVSFDRAPFLHYIASAVKTYSIRLSPDFKSSRHAVVNVDTIYSVSENFKGHLVIHYTSGACPALAFASS